MRLLITGSWRQHSNRVIADCLEALRLVDVDPSEVCTGGWVGIDKIAVEWATKRGIPVLDSVTPSDCDAAVWINCGKNTTHEQIAFDKLQLALKKVHVW